MTNTAHITTPGLTTPHRKPEDVDAALRPKTLSEFIGQEAARDNLRVFIEAAKQRGDALDHLLLFFSHYLSVAARWMLERQSPKVKQVQHDGIFHKQRHFQNQRHPELVSGSIAGFTQLVRNKQISQHTFLESRAIIND